MSAILASARDAVVAATTDRGTRSRESALITRVAANDREIDEILELRTACYRHVGKWRAQASMVDRFDREPGAIHIATWKDGVAVGAARLLVRSPEQEYEHDRFLTWDAIGLPPRETCVEVSRLCVRPKPREPGTLRSLLREIAWHSLNSGRQHLVACATRDLLPVYLRIFGATSTGHEFVHTDLGPKPHTMLYSNIPASIAGRTMPWHVWAALWAPVAVRAYRAGLLQPDAGALRRAVSIVHARVAAALPVGAAFRGR